jgi:UDP-2,3-diacylglucosamine pyrophosphatase LpxH
VRFAVSSDLHFGADNANRTATQGILENVVSHDYDMLFNLGDMVEYGLFDAQYKEAMDYMSPYVTRIPYRPVIGNHDTIFGGKTLWRDYFSHPDLIADSPTDYFHIEVNGIHVFILDLEWGTETYTRAQRKWFKSELAETSEDDWILVINHAMYYSSGYEVYGSQMWDNQAMIEEFEDLFIEHDVDLVFSGHNHHMEYLNNSGVVYNIIGAFGGILDHDYTTKEVGQEGTGSLWYLSGQHGYLDVEINGNVADIAFRTPEYVVMESYSILE